MKTLLVFIALTFCNFALADFAVIANNGISESSISKGDLKNIFIGKVKSFGGATLAPCVMGADTPAGTSFFNDVMGMSGSAFQKYWLEKELSGAGTAPESKSSSADAIAFASGKAGGICFIDAADAGQAAGKVKVLTVN